MFFFVLVVYNYILPFCWTHFFHMFFSFFLFAKKALVVSNMVVVYIIQFFFVCVLWTHRDTYQYKRHTLFSAFWEIDMLWAL